VNAERLDSPRNVYRQLKANLVSLHSPEVAACASVSLSVIGLLACLSPIVKRAVFIEVSL